MSLYGDYISERLGAKVIEREDCFLSYSMTTDAWHIEDMYVAPHRRLSGKGALLIEELMMMAKKEGVKHITAYVWPMIKGSDSTLQGALHIGFKLLSAENGKITIVKEIF